MRLSSFDTPQNHARYSLEFLLRGAFAGITLLLLTVSILGIWGIYHAEQPLATITHQNLPELQAISDVRITLLTQESDDRQVLFETNAAQYDADLDLLPTDQQVVQDTFSRLLSLTHGIDDQKAITQIRDAYAVWLTFQDRFAADLAQHTPTGYNNALSLQEGTGAFRQQGWLVVALLTQFQASEQSLANDAEVAATITDAHLLWALSGVTVGAFLLTIGLGIGVARYISKMHRHQVQVNVQLSESFGEIRHQHEEIQAQKDSLLAANTELEQTIEARKAAEEQLAATLEESQRSRNLLATIFETVREGLAVFDPSGSIIYRNTAYQSITNLPDILNSPAENAVESYQLMTMEGDIVPQALHPIARILHGEESDPPTIYRLSLANGIHRVVQMEAVPLIGVLGTHHALGVARDITAEYHDARNSEILRELAHACASASDEAAIAKAAVRVLVEGLNFSLCALIIRDRDREGFARVLETHFGPEFQPVFIQRVQEALCTIPIDPDAPLTTLQVLATGEARYNVAPLPIKIAEGTMPIPPSMRAASYLPIMVEQTTIGVLFVSHGPQQAAIWDDSERDLLQAVVDELGLAWHRAQLYEDTRRLALFDPLTGLHNHRALQQILLQEIAEAESHDTPLSVIMLDIDHFRRFNENYGHDVGDQALRTVAHAIQHALRPLDCVARYGGEEFTIILPGIAGDQAARVAERVRSAIADSRVIVPGIEEGVPITASLGFATLPFDAATPATLLKVADVALYAAKHNGRNQVVAYESSLSPFTSQLAS